MYPQVCVLSNQREAQIKLVKGIKPFSKGRTLLIRPCWHHVSKLSLVKNISKTKTVAGLTNYTVMENNKML